MKAFFRRLILWFLILCARRRLARLRRKGVRVIGVTGSVGKTTCKEAIAQVLNGSYRVHKNEKSYNSEFGLPLTILGLTSEFSSFVRMVFGWSVRLFLAAWRSVGPLPAWDILILEMGVDKPGDMEILLSIATPDIGIFLGAKKVHTAPGQFVDENAIFAEKSKLIAALPCEADGGVAFVNHDDERMHHFVEHLRRHRESASAMSGSVVGGAVAGDHGGAVGSDFGGAAGGAAAGMPKIIPFGFTDGAKIHAFDASSGWGKIFFHVKYGEVGGNFDVPILGVHHISSLLPAIGCGLIFGLYMPDIVERVRGFHLPPGRLSLIPGRNQSWILDSSYNSSPTSVRAALHTLHDLVSHAPHDIRRKIFVFGTMNELGTSAESDHRQVADMLPGKIDLLVTVGAGANAAALHLLERGSFPRDKIFSFETSDLAADYIANILQSGDMILVKGSQNNVRLERLVKRIMMHPDQASTLLVRQDWAQ